MAEAQQIEHNDGHEHDSPPSESGLKAHTGQNSTLTGASERKPGKPFFLQRSWPQPAFGGNQRVTKRPNFALDFVWVRDSLCDCFPQV